MNILISGLVARNDAALVRKLHELAGGEENIIMYTCFNENAYGFYEKLGMHKPDDVVVLNKVAWTDSTVM